MKYNIQKIIEAVSNTYGENFFNAITLTLHNIIKSDYTFIAIFDKDAYTSKTIALVAKDELADNFEYSLSDTPCANVFDDSVCCYKNNVCNLFPKDQLLIDMKIKAYIGTPLHDSNQNVIGLMVALYETPFEKDQDVITLFKIFSGRIAAELERRKYEATLEERVLSRTLALSNTIERLQLTQHQLIESEKMAALGGLVAGIAHEVNTPLGIAITTHSIISDEHKQLSKKIASENLSMKDMEHYRHTVGDALAMQEGNLIRAKKLIENFKKTAVDQHQLALEKINIKNYYINVVSTLNSMLKTKRAALKITGDDNITLTTYPGVHAQILTNLITNSIRHGFKDNKDNQIIINIIQHNNTVKVHYQDNGVGLSKNAKEHVFDPFYTTARKSGGVGLGMSIVYNLITQKLQGKIFIDKDNNGACFIYQFKANTENK